jgi:porphobilinogen synthase
MFPLRRPRRNRNSETLRTLISENTVPLSSLIVPIFLQDGKNKKIEIKSMPDYFRFSIDLAVKEVEQCLKLGLKTFILFPQIEDGLKNKKATYSIAKNSFYLKAISEIKKQFPETVLITDVAMDPYSSDGHDGFVQNGKILNDETLDILGKMAVAQVDSGADIIGPSDMMDGRVQSIRKYLDTHKHKEIPIMSYTAKYASAYYGPFRDALNSAPKSGDKKTYQMNPANSKEALIDFLEGADILLVKPALHYLDIIFQLNRSYNIPIFSYHVSGEYSMLKYAALNGILDEKLAVEECFLSLKRAGSTAIISYYAKFFAKTRSLT